MRIAQEFLTSQKSITYPNLTPMKLVSLVCLLAVCVTFMHCGGSDPAPVVPTAEEVVLEALTADGGTWGQNSASTVLVDGTNVTSDLFAGFSIKFTASGYTTTGTTPVFPRSDTWSFKPGTDGTVIIRGHDDREIEIISMTDTELVIDMEWDQTTYEEGGRSKSIQGTHRFTLKK